MTPEDLMRQIDVQFSHVWMVRTFLKHSEEAAEDDELREVHRQLYDVMLALGGPFSRGEADDYLKYAKKKLGKLRQAVELFVEIQPEVSSHTNFAMAARSLTHAFAEIERLLQQAK